MSIEGLAEHISNEHDDWWDHLTGEKRTGEAILKAWEGRINGRTIEHINKEVIKLHHQVHESGHLASGNLSILSHNHV